jgi:molecular chaperone IbpA
MAKVPSCFIVDLKRNIPEELKPRKIAINSAPAKAKQIEAKAAAH